MAHCRRHDFRRVVCGAISAHVARLAADAHGAEAATRRALLAAAAAPLPPIQRLPTPAAPFVFLHHEKCAGTSLRREIVDAAVALAVDWRVPCFLPNGTQVVGTMLCMGFGLDDEDAEALSEVAVVAGHYQWGVWESMRSFVGGAGGGASPPPCFVMARDPVARAISYYYERVYPQSGVALSDLSVDDWEWYVVNWRGSAFSRYRDEGLSNAMCKMLTGAKTHSGRFPNETEADPAAATATFPDALLATRRLSQCVVGVQEEWADTTRVIRHYFPWIPVADRVRGNVGFSAAGEVAPGAALETAATLPRALIDVFDTHNRCDLALHAAALERFRAQRGELGGAE